LKFSEKKFSDLSKEEKSQFEKDFVDSAIYPSANKMVAPAFLQEQVPILPKLHILVYRYL
jgi:hypothetical protein